MRTALIIAGLLMLFGITVIWAIWGWQQTAGVEMSWHGYAALLLGVVCTAAVGFGLMALMFYSSRRGFDEKVSDLTDGRTQFPPKPEDTNPGIEDRRKGS